MNTILLATDGSPSAAEATREAIELTQALDAQLLVVSVVHVVAVPSYGYYGYGEVHSELLVAEQHHVQRVLEAVAVAANEAGVDCETISETGLAIDEICRVARERDAKMIVIGAHGWGALHRLVFGSVSTGVLHNAPCAVLVVPSAAVGTVDRVHADAAAV
jgi:nucleotide-binding universal stress UspA family protein